MTVGHPVHCRRLALPKTVDRGRIRWRYAIGIGAMHVLALLALIPSLFTWAGAVTAIVGLYLFGTIGINLCYHRLLAHRSFQCSSWFEHTLAIIGVCCLQDTPAHWVAIHRMHHQHSDEQPDPHTPLVSFLWSHMGWLMVENSELARLSMFEHYVRDLLHDPFYHWLERKAKWMWINVAQWAVFFGGGFLASWLTSQALWPAVVNGMSLLVWGVFVRTVAVWHITWSVNSFTHLWGYRTYKTGEDSRNNFLVALWANGEGWHNNHHMQPRAASHGHRWWELDVTYLTLRLLVVAGLAWDVVLPDQRGSSAIH